MKYILVFTLAVVVTYFLKAHAAAQPNLMIEKVYPHDTVPKLLANGSWIVDSAGNVITLREGNGGAFTQRDPGFFQGLPIQGFNNDPNHPQYDTTIELRMYTDLHDITAIKPVYCRSFMIIMPHFYSSSFQDDGIYLGQPYKIKMLMPDGKPVPATWAIFNADVYQP